MSGLPVEAEDEQFPGFARLSRILGGQAKDENRRMRIGLRVGELLVGSRQAPLHPERLSRWPD